ncbi:hypothetical protein C1Y40_04526 [Mycobacterium talmoniae]|uniref:ESX secretion-associated protein EspG n=1 Tax=Mycobacterium talmoniae TaxID=1858794 RepID=A0A2S8BF51_9MYCO|nr:ESX secretion-associated protein EspG [Mycobacterium eburneum]PQM45301.1 hypothetical protein C1Y40_04526 [Mycobacterium talmoniae]TDH48463.1 hypothetical protein E2F47_23645 [Mycobacterium eburneum]
MPVAVAELTLSVSALLAFQRLASITMLPAHLRIRPQLLQIADTVVSLTDDERDTLTQAGMLRGGDVDSDALVILRALAYPDTEINMTLAAAQRDDTYVCLARRDKLVVVASRCGDEVTIDAYTNLDEPQLVGQLAATIRRYVFADDSSAPTAAIDRVSFPLSTVYDAMCTQDPQEWSTELCARGLPRSVAGVLQRSETQLQARGEVAAYLNHEGGRSAPDMIARVTATADEAIITSFASDNNGQRWLTVEPYEEMRLERVILAAIRSVPRSAWFTHARTD